MRIGLDIDDVLFPWSQHAHAACERAGITNGASITRWRFFEDYGCTADEFWDVVNAEYQAGMLSREPYPGVVALLDAARNAGHSVHLVTARGFEGPLAELIRTTTATWSTQIPHDTLTFAKDKSLVKVDAFLDDSAANVESLLEHGVDAYLHDQPHNRSHVGLPRVADLREFLEAVLGREVTA